MTQTSATESRGDLATAVEQAKFLLPRDAALAETQCREILNVVPHAKEALALLCHALIAQGKVESAVTALDRALTQDPENADLWRALGDQFILLEDFSAADRAYGRHLRAAVNDPRLSAAATALCANELPIAERLLKAHLKEHPTDIGAMRMLAELAGRIGRNTDAENLLRRAIELAPSFEAARFNLATVLYRTTRFREAIDELDLLLERRPQSAAYRNLKAASLSRLGDHDSALEYFEAALRGRSDEPAIWMSYGHVLKSVGRQADSITAYRESIKLRPTLGEAWWSLANLKTYAFGAPDIAHMKTLLAARNLSDEDRFHLHFALGKAEEDAGNSAESFTHYESGNRGRRALIRYDAEDTTRAVTRAASVFSRELFESRSGQGASSREPIFVIGMPRSGSTLIEQILASHPLVEGTQELHDIQALARRLTRADPHQTDESYPENLHTLDGAILGALGTEYVERTRIFRKLDRPLFVDKMPNNWLHVGLIHLILPNAKIIDARRHPLDCCFSNYKQHFARGQVFTYDLTDLGRYYADYVRLMDHFDSALPGRVHRIFYENMVNDSENEIRRLLDYLEIPFDVQCLRFHETKRAVQTASSEQVRRPINRDGIGKWVAYERWLDPLKNALGPVLTAYPYP